MWNEIAECLPTDSARQTSAMDYARQIAPNLPEGAVVLDVGCGTGISIDLFSSVAPQVCWVGIDIETSPEVLSRTRTDGDFRTFNGVHIPLRDGSVDLVYSRQVFEHVREPEPLLAEIRRVLRPGAPFIGSTSHLEPYHSHSLWNYTPVGFKRIVTDAGMRVRELRPGIDGISLIRRAYERRDEMNGWFAGESPLNREIDAWAKDGGHSVAVTAFRKLAFCGQFAFWVERPG